MNGLSCRDAVELVTVFLDHELDSGAERLLTAHLPTCTGCRRYVSQIQFMVETLAGLTAEGLPTQIRNVLLVAYRARPQAS